MSHCESPGLMPIEQALKQQDAHIQPVTDSEFISIFDANGRIIAQQVDANINVPSADNSAMDGYALKAQNSHVPLNIIGQVLAGHPFNGTLEDGEAVRIMTGAPIPPGANAVIMQEQTKLVDGQLICEASVKKGQCIRLAGEDIKKGSVIIESGERLNAAHVSLLSSLGMAQVKVLRKLKVGVIATGDELVTPGETLQDGELYESNRCGLIAMLARFPVDIIDYGIVKDDLQSTRDTFAKASAECDWVISSGGVSVGDADFVKQVLDELGEINFWKVAIKPGKPYAFGRLGKCYFSGLPGNPVSSFVTFMQLVTPSLKRLCGEYYQPATTLKAKLHGKIRRRAGRTEFQRAVMWNNENGDLFVTPKNKQGSGIMNSFTGANCFLIIPAETSEIDDGEFVAVQPLNGML